MKRPLPTSIPSIIPAAVLAEAKKKNLVYVGTGDGRTDMFRPAIQGYYWEQSHPISLYATQIRLKGPEEIIGHLDYFHFFLPRKTAAKFFDVPKAPKTRYIKPCRPNLWKNGAILHKILPDGRNIEVFKDGVERDYGSKIQDSPHLKDFFADGSWIEITAAEAKTYLASFKKPAPTALELLTAENAALKARVAKLEAAIREASKVL